MTNASTHKKDDKGNMGHGVQDLKDKAQDAAHTLTEKAKEMGSSAANVANSAAGSVGEGMKSLAGTIRENAPREGMLGTASGAVAGTVESAGNYLHDQGLTGASGDFLNLIKRNPIPAVLVGIGVGFLIGRMMQD